MTRSSNSVGNSYHMTLRVSYTAKVSTFIFKENIKISPGTSTSIQLFGDVPCTFTSGTAIIRVQLVELDSLSIL